MNRSEFKRIIGPFLAKEDDLEFWVTVFDTLTHEFDSLYSFESHKHEIFFQIGACSHWLRPHQLRWTAAGGFAAPAGYQGNSVYGCNGLPEFDWFVILRRDQQKAKWVQVEKLFGKRKLVCRVALPTRTQRHEQAAINAIWSPGTPTEPRKKCEVLYGFRKSGDAWNCVTSTER
jgi:hypothetical protein